MKIHGFEQTLLDRQRLGLKASANKSLYGARLWVERLDIVNELHAHTGCVNTLCWSDNGDLLASGSDDTHINIHTTSPTFNWNTSIATGHRANIFSVKFMPYSSNRTIVSAAGDREIRIFDIEYAPKVNTVERSALYNTNATPLKTIYASQSTKVYRSHNSRVKRILPEDSPYLFLSCSEDGDIRQFDLRQPSSYYMRVGRNSSSSQPRDHSPPLISYRPYRIELNAASCSMNQPYYIAVGGSHQYGFLHDRRMMGRDMLTERGVSGPLSDNDLQKATRCVRRFTAKKSSEGRLPNHITSCKISNTNPNQVLFSWSADGVYLFDINTSPEDSEEKKSSTIRSRQRRVSKDSSLRSRSPKRQKRSSTSRQRASSPDPEDVTQVRGYPGMSTVKIPRLLCTLRSEIFSQPAQATTEDALREAFNTAICTAKVLYSRMDKMKKRLDALQSTEGRDRQEAQMNKARQANRQKALMFVQCAGVLSKVLGGVVARGTDSGELPSSEFDILELDLEDGHVNQDKASFNSMFFRMLMEFLKSGKDGVKEMVWRTYRKPVDNDDANRDELEARKREFLQQHFDLLVRKAQYVPLRRVRDVQPIFPSHKQAVREFRDLFESMTDPMPNSDMRKQWGIDVSRALLMEIFEGVNHQFVQTAYQGDEEQSDDGSDVSISELENIGGMVTPPVDSDEEMSGTAVVEGVNHESSLSSNGEDSRQIQGEEQGESANNASQVTADPYHEGGEHDEEDDDGDFEDDDHDREEDEEEEGEGDGEDDEDEEDDLGMHDDEDVFGRRRVRWDKVEENSPLWEHTKRYTGHCNVKTVKDVNFYGQNDEYVVSGSDCGHVFIWDKTTTEIVQLLRGDDEVVNVIQGHPTQPMLAVSGIDDTVKIFSPDRAAQASFRRAALLENGADEKDLDGVEMLADPDEPDPEGVSRRRLYDVYQILSNNESAREGDFLGASGFVSRAMLENLVGAVRMVGPDGRVVQIAGEGCAMQ